MSTGEYVFRVGRRIGKHPMAGRIFCATERLLPVKRLARTTNLVAFHHPRPIADPHILVVPTRPFASLTSSRPDDQTKASLIWQMTQLARRISIDIRPDHAWQLVINGGERQDIGQVHGHLLLANDDPPGGERELVDPEHDFTAWSDLFEQMHAAAKIPENGFSLVIQWNLNVSLAADVTQSRATV